MTPRLSTPALPPLGVEGGVGTNEVGFITLLFMLVLLLESRCSVLLLPLLCFSVVSRSIIFSTGERDFEGIDPIHSSHLGDFEGSSVREDLRKTGLGEGESGGSTFVRCSFGENLFS